MILIELNNLENAVEKIRYGDYEKESNSIGSVIKNKRYEMRKTLEEVCKGICCVGFLSKLERNKLDNLNNPIVMKLCERLDLDYESLSKTKTKDELLNALTEYSFNRFSDLKKRYDGLNKDFFLSQNALIECLYYLVVEDYNKFNLKINKLDVVKKSMTALELSTLLILMVNYYLKTYQYKKAKEYLDIIDAIGFDEFPLNVLKREARFYISCNLDKKEIENDYNNIKMFYDIGYPVSKQFLLRLEYLKNMENKEHAYEILCSLEKDISDELKEEYYYTRVYLLASLNKNIDVCNLILEKKLSCYRFIALFSYALYQIKKNKEIDKSEFSKYLKSLNLLNRDSKYRNEDSIHMGFLRLMQMEIDEQTDVCIYNYLKNQMLLDLDSFYNQFYYDYCVKRFYGLAGKLCKYKDAYLMFGLKINKEDNN